jgi:raffinose/stachyose/melibiose transport system permease protein
MNTKRLTRGIQPFLAILACISIIGIPLYLLVITSFKSDAEAQVPDLSLPTTWHIVENYGRAIRDGDVLGGLFGSLLVTVPSVFGVLVLGSAASWVLARRSSKVMGLLYSVGISGIILPPAVVTMVLTLQSLGLDGSALGMIGVYMGMFMATAIFFTTGFVRNIPVELEEAARIDGASPFKVYVRIVLPLLRPVIATAAILVTLSVWNEVFYAFFVLSGSGASTLPLNLFNVASQSEYVKNWNLIFAYVVLMSIPMVVTFIIAQRRIVAGVTAGAVK